MIIKKLTPVRTDTRTRGSIAGQVLTGHVGGLEAKCNEASCHRRPMFSRLNLDASIKRYGRELCFRDLPDPVCQEWRDAGRPFGDTVICVHQTSQTLSYPTQCQKRVFYICIPVSKRQNALNDTHEGKMIGSVDYMSFKSARGWVYDHDDQKVVVTAYANGEIIGTTVASELRPDLKAAGIGDGYHAFYFEIPEANRGDTIEFVAEDFTIPAPTNETADEYLRWRFRRKENLLKHVPLGAGKGIEFGPLHDPLIQPNTKNIRYVDHTSTEGLKKKYRTDPNVSIRDLVDIDYPWESGVLSDIVGDFAPIDYAVALHVGEHVPDLIGWFAQIRAIMAPGAIFSLALPDKRYCFDYKRRLSNTADLINAHLIQPSKPLPVAVFDHCANAVSRNDQMSWYTWQEEPQDAVFTNIHTLDEAYQITVSSIEAYVDAHCWVFTSDSFRETMTELKSLGLFPFMIKNITGPDGNEFIVILEAD